MESGQEQLAQPDMSAAFGSLFDAMAAAATSGPMADEARTLFDDFADRIDRLTSGEQPWARAALNNILGALATHQCGSEGTFMTSTESSKKQEKNIMDSKDREEDSDDDDEDDEKNEGNTKKSKRQGNLLILSRRPARNRRRKQPAQPPIAHAHSHKLSA